MCGESSMDAYVDVPDLGSPPHVWGKRQGRYSGNVRNRITPTCVGKAGDQSQFWGSERDHPHMCGESNDNPVNQMSDAGSPPHVWGKLNDATKDFQLSGITPTCVGKA